MAIEFPNSPVEGDQFTASNGVIYTYENGGWNGNSASGLEDVFVNISGDEMSGNLTVPSLNGGPLGGFRNQLINADFRVWARGTSVVYGPPVGGYTADRWGTGANTTTSQRSKYGGVPVAELLGSFYLLQGVELHVDAFSGEATGPLSPNSTWTLSYYATKAPDGAISNIAQFRDVANDGTAVSNPVDIATISTPTATGETLGTGGVLVRYSTTFTITGTPATTNRCAVFHITGDSNDVDFAYAQLEPGPVATPFEHRPIGTELALCQRYYESYFSPNNNNLTWMGTGMAPSAGYSGYATSTTLTFNTTKRVIPTCVMYGLDSGSGFPPNQLHIQDTESGVNAAINSYTTTIRGVSPVFAAAEKTRYNVLCFGYTADAEL